MTCLGIGQVWWTTLIFELDVILNGMVSTRGSGCRVFPKTVIFREFVHSTEEFQKAPNSFCDRINETLPYICKDIHMAK